MAGHGADFALRMARRTSMNHQSLKVFAVSIAVLAAIYILFHFVRRRGRKLQLKPLVVLSRQLRSTFARKGLWLPSAGHAVVVAIYLTINLVVLFTNHDPKNMRTITNIAARAAWLAMGNMVLIVFLALKNTPLAFLTAWSYERLNVLHQVAGYATVVLVILHASLYTSYFVDDGRPEKMMEPDMIFGMVAGLSFLMLGISGAVFRRWWYELFYYLHITFWITGIITVGLHQPLLADKAVIMVFVAGGMWASDRLLRIARLVLYSANNSVTLTPLSNGGTRVTMKKAPFGAVEGKHCFLWIPKIRSVETHPFTISALNPLEFVVAPYDGFTGDLHRYAVSHPGVSLTASAEGCYGTIPDPSEYSTIVLVAGGSGSSFTFGMALRLLRWMKEDETKKIVFIWMVKHASCLDWYSTHLSTLQRDPRVSIKLYVTRSPLELIKSKHDSFEASSRTEVDPEKADMAPTAARMSSFSIDSETIPSEKRIATSDEREHPDDYRGIPIEYGRPDTGPLIEQAVNDTPRDQRALVAACGPDGLMTHVRNTTAACIRTDGPGVELHCEQFGW